MAKKELKNYREIGERQEFYFVLEFTFIIPVVVTLIQIVINGETSFLNILNIFIINIVPSTIAYAGVIVIQNVITITKHKTSLCKWTILTMMILVVDSIVYAVTITYNGNEMNKIALWGLPLSLLALTAILVSFSAVSYYEAKYVQVRKVKRKFSGEDY